MNETDENLQRPKSQTPRRLGLGLRSSRHFPAQKTPSTSKTAIKLYRSPAIDESTPTKVRKIDSDASDAKEARTLSTSNIQIGERTIYEIQMNIKRMECRLAKYEKYEKRTNEMEKMIEMWRASGQTALQMLQDAINPKQEMGDILKHLNLPENIFDVKQIE